MPVAYELIKKEFWLTFFPIYSDMSVVQLLIKTDKSDKDMAKLIFSIYVKAHDNSKKQHEAKILFTNQRPPAEHGPGPFEGPSSYPQLCWWSLI
jgi:hypothetical protein